MFRTGFVHCFSCPLLPGLCPWPYTRSVISESPHRPFIFSLLFLLDQSDTLAFNLSMAPYYLYIHVLSFPLRHLLFWTAPSRLFSSQCSPHCMVQPHRMTCLPWHAPCPWDFARSILTAWDMLGLLYPYISLTRPLFSFGCFFLKKMSQPSELAPS